MDSFVTNNHLKDAIEIFRGYLENDEDAPMEFMLKFMCELKVSYLLVPGIDEGDSFAFEHVSVDDVGLFIPLFTDLDEYNKYADGDDEFSPMAFDFEMYEDLVLESDVEGIVLNIDGNFMPLNREFIEDISEFTEIETDDEVEPYSPEELKGIFESVSNDSLVEFIRGDDADDIERLYVELSNSTMLNLVVSEEPLSDEAENGIIKYDEFGLCSIEDEGVRLGAIFTDKKAMEKAINHDSGLTYYGQVTVLTDLFDFILRSDMDGVVINPNTDDYLIVRDDILPQATGIEIVIDDEKLRDSIFYAFLL